MVIKEAFPASPCSRLNPDKAEYILMSLKVMVHIPDYQYACTQYSYIIIIFVQEKIKRCYTVISSYRPVFTYHGTLGVSAFIILHM